MGKNTKKNVTVQSPEPQPRRLGLLILLFVAAFGLAFGLAWLLFRADPASAPPAAAQAETEKVDPPLTAEQIAPFLRAADEKDLDTMFRLGPELFGKGRTIVDRKDALAEYETNSFPPYQVYAFYAGIRENKVYRVLLTTDEDDKVESFLAEAMPIE